MVAKSCAAPKVKPPDADEDDEDVSPNLISEEDWKELEVPPKPNDDGTAVVADDVVSPPNLNPSLGAAVVVSLFGVSITAGLLISVVDPKLNGVEGDVWNRFDGCSVVVLSEEEAPKVSKDNG